MIIRWGWFCASVVSALLGVFSYIAWGGPRIAFYGCCFLLCGCVALFVTHCQKKHGRND